MPPKIIFLKIRLDGDGISDHHSDFQLLLKAKCVTKDGKIDHCFQVNYLFSLIEDNYVFVEEEKRGFKVFFKLF